MTGYQLTLALEGSLHDHVQRSVSKLTRHTAQQTGPGGIQNLLSSKQLLAQKLRLSPMQIN